MQISVLDDVHAFWFGELSGPSDFPAHKIPLWFGSDPQTDAEIAAAFGAWIDVAAAEAWDLEALTPRQRVGLVVLLDQFPRNCFRGIARVYAHDRRAAELALRLLALPMDGLTPIERMFAVVPLGHSEDIELQDKAVDCFDREILPHAGTHPFWAGATRQVHLYRDIIGQFGRFPHRNALLGRTTTEAEARFVSETKMTP